jgi:hypothetical protein
MFETDIAVTLLTYEGDCSYGCKAIAQWRLYVKQRKRQRCLYLCRMCGPKLRMRIANCIFDQTQLSPDVVRLIVNYVV